MNWHRSTQSPHSCTHMRSSCRRITFETSALRLCRRVLVIRLLDGLVFAESEMRRIPAAGAVGPSQAQLFRKSVAYTVNGKMWDNIAFTVAGNACPVRCTFLHNVCRATLSAGCAWRQGHAGSLFVCFVPWVPGMRVLRCDWSLVSFCPSF